VDFEAGAAVEPIKREVGGAGEYHIRVTRQNGFCRRVLLFEEVGSLAVTEKTVMVSTDVGIKPKSEVVH